MTIQYVIDCRRSAGSDSVGYIKCVIEHARQYARGVGKVEKVTIALFGLQTSQPGRFFSRAQIANAAGVLPESVGVWPWLGKYGGYPVVDKHGMNYRYSDQYFPAMRKALNQLGLLPQTQSTVQQTNLPQTTGGRPTPP